MKLAKPLNPLIKTVNACRPTFKMSSLW